MVSMQPVQPVEPVFVIAADPAVEPAAIVIAPEIAPAPDLVADPLPAARPMNQIALAFIVGSGLVREWLEYERAEANGYSRPRIVADIRMRLAPRML